MNDLMCTKKILIVEDNQDLAFLLGIRFRREGWETFVYSDPVAALEVLKNEKFDVMLTDQMMPNLSGTEIIEKAKEIGADVSLFVIYTGDLTVIEQGGTFPRDVWIVKKPADLKKLADDIERELT